MENGLYICSNCKDIKIHPNYIIKCIKCHKIVCEMCMWYNNLCLTCDDLKVIKFVKNKITIK